MIEGVKVIPLKQIPDGRGTVMYMLERTDPHFVQFGEIYLTTGHPGVVKGWHQHGRMVLNSARPYGRIKLVLYDDREDASTRGEVMELFLGPDDYKLCRFRRASGTASRALARRPRSSRTARPSRTRRSSHPPATPSTASSPTTGPRRRRTECGSS
jgi:hypothetical protein